MNKTIICLATLAAMSVSNALPVVAADTPPKPSEVSLEADDYGYAGIAYDPQEDGTLVVESLLPGSPAASSALKPKDKIVAFKIKEKSDKVYKQLNRTISFNPHKTLILKATREDSPGKTLSVSLKIGSYKDNPDPARFAGAVESRKLFAKALPFTPQLQKVLGRTPHIIEIYAPDEGPSKVLLGARLLGVKAVSVGVGSNAAKLIGQSGFPVDKADIYLVTPDGLLYPYLLPGSELEALKMAKEFGVFELGPRAPEINRIVLSQKNPGWIEAEQHHAGNMMVTFDQRGGHFSSGFSYMHQVEGTWPKSEAKVQSKDAELIKALTNEIIKLIDDDTIDLKAGQKLCVGEASLYGNSIKAANISRPAFASLGKLDGNQLDVKMISGETAVVRVHHLSEPFNTYMYMVKSKGTGWRLSAIRSPVDAESLKLAKMDLVSGDKRFDQAEKDWRQSHPVASQTIDTFNAKNLALSGQEDSQLSQWFGANKEVLNNLASQCLKELRPNVVVFDKVFFSRGLTHSDQDGKQMIEGTDIEARLGQLGLSSALMPRSNNIFIGLKQIKNSDTGFLYSVDNDPPPINPYGCYWWQKLDDHWYLVRTISGYFPQKLR